MPFQNLQAQPQALGFHTGNDRGGIDEANFPTVDSVLSDQNKEVPPCKGRWQRVALWHLEVGV